MSDLKSYLEHYRKKLDRSQHDKSVCISVISKLNSIHVTKELLEETGIWKPLRTLSRKGDEVGKDALPLYKKWRKLIEDSPKKETIFQPPKNVASNSDSNSSHLDHISKPHYESPSKSASKHQHLSSSKSNSKSHIPSQSDFKHKIPFPNLNSKSNVTSPSCPTSLITKNSSPKKEVKAVLSLDAHIAKKQKDNLLACQDLNPDHNLVKSSTQDLKHNHKPINQERKVTKPVTHESQKPDFIVKKHVVSSHDKNKSVPSHSNPESVSCEYNQPLYQKTTDKPPVHYKGDFNDFTKSASDQKSSKLSSHPDLKNNSLLDSPFSSQKNKSLSCQKSESVFNSDASNAFLTISHSEKTGSTDQLNFEDDTNLTSASSPAKKLVLEPYAIDMREGMFRVVKTSEDVPQNIMRLQQMYDNDLMEERPKKAATKSKDERNGKKPVNLPAQAKGAKIKAEGSPSTPSKNKKPSVGTKDSAAKTKVHPTVPASQPLSGSPLVEKVPFLSVNKSKVSAEENSAFKESRKPLKKGETSCSPHAQKVRKTSHTIQ